MGAGRAGSPCKQDGVAGMKVAAGPSNQLQYEPAAAVAGIQAMLDKAPH
jgi:hypothetical protein